MKPLATVLTAAILVAAGIFVYDGYLRAPESGRAPRAARTEAPPPGLGKGRIDRVAELLDELMERVAAQEREIAQIRSDLARRDPVSARRDDEFDAGTLDDLEARLDAIDERRRARHEVLMIERNLDRLDLRLGADERAAAVAAVVEQRTRRRAFWKEMADRGITDHAQQMKELEKLQKRGLDALEATIGEQAAKKVFDGLLGSGTRPPPGVGGPPREPRRPR